MKITFLGTGGMSAVPVWNCDCPVCQSKDLRDKRTNAALLVEIEQKNLEKYNGAIEAAYDGMAIKPL